MRENIQERVKRCLYFDRFDEKSVGDNKGRGVTPSPTRVLGRGFGGAGPAAARVGSVSLHPNERGEEGGSVKITTE